MDPVGGSSAKHQSVPPACRSAATNSSPQRGSSSALAASPSQDPDVDKGQLVAGLTSRAGSPSNNVRSFPELELGHGLSEMRGLDLGPCEPSSTYRHQGGGASPEDILQESSEQLLAQWAQLFLPDEASLEEFLQLDDLDSLLLDCSGVRDLSNQAQFADSPCSGTPENFETLSTSEHIDVGDLETSRGDRTASSGSAGDSTVKIPGKRKYGGGAGATGDSVEPSNIQQEQFKDAPALQMHLIRGPKRLDKSTRCAFETRSDVDIVDDGYKWRKYGQKPVKNSAHPRNYYRCTTRNCPVRKQVERCTEDPRNVLTTYDGIHNHPKNPSCHSAGESTPLGDASGIAGESTLPAPAPGSNAAKSSPRDCLLRPPRLTSIPSNYIPPHLLDQMLTSTLLESGIRWPNPLTGAGASVSERNIDFLKMHQFFMMQYQKQYPLLAHMFNIMRNYSLPRPPLLDPGSFALLAAQNYGMRSRSTSGPQANPEYLTSRPNYNGALNKQASRSAPGKKSPQ